jgi:hypothetical protein
VVSLVLELDEKVLSEAERQDGSASKLIAAVESVTPFTPSLQSHKVSYHLYIHSNKINIFI